jgi:hypothetical protein
VLKITDAYQLNPAEEASDDAFAKIFDAMMQCSPESQMAQRLFPKCCLWHSRQNHHTTGDMDFPVSLADQLQRTTPRVPQ